MLRIRAKQQNQVALDLFIERMQRHWQENFADKFAAFSEDEVKQFARDAVQQSQAEGIEDEDDIVVYADLCLVSESGFASQLKSQEKPNV